MDEPATLESSLVKHLSSFNRKERFWLLANALSRFDKPLPLNSKFCGDLSDQVGVTVPESAWWAMDYHIDWLIGAGYLMKFPSTDPSWPNPLLAPAFADKGETKRLVTGTQEDVDLIIAFESTLILIEAKGESSWTNVQVNSKVRRLREIFDVHKLFADVDRHFVLMSPRKSQGLKPDTGTNWPEWMNHPKEQATEARPKFIELTMPTSGLRKVVRCDSNGETSAVDEHFKVKNTK